MSALDEAINRLNTCRDDLFTTRRLLEQAVTALEDPDMGGYERTTLADQLRAALDDNTN